MLHCNSLKERLSGVWHPHLHAIAHSTDEHSEHDGDRVDRHAAGVCGFVFLGGVCLQPLINRYYNQPKNLLL